MPDPDATPNVPDMTNVRTTRLVSSLAAKILVVNPIPMFVDPEPTVKSRTTNPSALVPEASLEIHLCLAESSPRKTCANPILVDLELDANLDLTDLEVTDRFVLVHQATEEIHCCHVPEANVKTIVNAQPPKLASILPAKIRVKMLVA